MDQFSNGAFRIMRGWPGFFNPGIRFEGGEGDGRGGRKSALSAFSLIRIRSVFEELASSFTILNGWDAMGIVFGGMSRAKELGTSFQTKFRRLRWFAFRLQAITAQLDRPPRAFRAASNVAKTSPLHKLFPLVLVTSPRLRLTFSEIFRF